MKMQVVKGLFLYLFALSVMLSGAATTAHAWPAEVISVGDGDSLKVMRDKRIVKIRLYGIDSPEMEQAHGRASRHIARQRLQGRMVEVQEMYRDNYGRTVALVWSEDTLINAELVRVGSAWLYPRFCRAKELCEPMARLQEEARLARLGLWQDERAEPPWKWKRRHPQAKRR